EVFGDQDVARAEALHGPVADLDIHRARQREDRVTPGRVVPRIGALGLEAADDDPAAGNQLGALGLVTERLPLGTDLLEMRLFVRARVDADDRHALSFSGRVPAGTSRRVPAGTSVATRSHAPKTSAAGPRPTGSGSLVQPIGGCCRSSR